MQCLASLHLNKKHLSVRRQAARPLRRALDDMAWERSCVRIRQPESEYSSFCTSDQVLPAEELHSSSLVV